MNLSSDIALRNLKNTFVMTFLIIFLSGLLFLPLSTDAYATGIALPLQMPLKARIAKLKLVSPQLGLAFSQKPLPLFKLKRSRKTIEVNYNKESKLLVFEEIYGNFENVTKPLVASPKAYQKKLIDSHTNKIWREQIKLATKKRGKKRGGSVIGFEIPWRKPPKIVRSILGEGGAKLDVSGYRKITFSGRSSWNDQQDVATAKQSKFPSLNMEQFFRFKIKGQIGSKIFVNVDQDSKRQQTLANKIVLRYQGSEDDIIKKIELGNTNLSLPRTKFIGYSQSIRGLFGIKTEAEIGALKLTAIASQEKSSNEITSFKAGAQESGNLIRDYNYIKDYYFDLTRRDSIVSETDLIQGDSITKIEFYIPPRRDDRTEAFHAVLYADPSDPEFYANETLRGKYIEYGIEKGESMRPIYYPKEHYIKMRQQLNDPLGVYIEFKRPGVDTLLRIGQLPENPGDSLKLKLIRGKNPQPSQFTWRYMWRNVYSLGTGQIEDINDLQIQIFKGNALSVDDIDASELDHQRGELYIDLLKIGDGSGLINRSNQIIDDFSGHLFFPSSTPFASDALDQPVSEIYTSGTQQDWTDASKYYLLVKASSFKTRATEYSLGHFDIVENSENVTLGNRKLIKGQDYRIHYNLGRIEFLNEEALDPNADLNVTFEYAPLFSSEKKTLLGLRGEYEVSKYIKFGSTLLYKSEKQTDRKTRIGEEPSKFLNIDTDAKVSFETNLPTQLVNALPLVEAKAPSRITLSGEIGQSLPNPNTKGEAFIDDFEGSRERYSLGITREGWHFASQPDESHLQSGAVPGRMIWYNPFNQIRLTDVYNRDVRVGDDRTHILVLEHTPRGDDKSSSWGGVMKSLSKGVWNQSRTQFIELRVKGKKGVLHIDLGEISEDLNDNNILDTEDFNSNDIIDDGEDTGLDLLFDEVEECDPLDPDCDENTTDKAGDNWEYSSDNPDFYDFINGTEGNRRDPGVSGRPDTEDLNNDQSLDTRNSYFSWTIDLTRGDFVVDGSENENNWYTIRIPFQDSTLYQTVGDPDRAFIYYARIWLDDISEDSSFLQIADIELTRNIWEIQGLLPADKFRPEVDSTRFEVSVVNDEEHSTYTSPPGVEGFFDKTTGLTATEQSLNIDFFNFTPGDTGFAERIPIKQEDLTGYKKLEMYVHGDSLRENVEFFFRVGSNDENYYEYRTDILREGWNEQNYITIAFDEMTPLKLKLEDLKAEYPDSNINEFSEGRYRIVGRPSLTMIKYYALGVTVNDSLGADVRTSGNIWANELRVTDVRRDRGLAAFVNGSMTFSDFASINFSYDTKDAFFRTLTSGNRSQLGSGKKAVNISYSGHVNLHKFLPAKSGAKLKLTFSWSKRTDTPRLITGSDIVVPDELAYEERTESRITKFSINESFKNNTSKHPLFTLFLNKFSSRFSYTKSQGRTPTEPVRDNERYDANAKYLISGRNDSGLKFMSWARFLKLPESITETWFNPLPTSFSVDGTVNRNLTETKRIIIGTKTSRTVTYTRTFKGNLNTSFDPFSSMNLVYSMKTDRDLADPELLKFSFNPKEVKIGQEKTYSETFRMNYKPKEFIIPLLTSPTISFTSSHSENLDPQRQAEGTRRVDNSRTLNVSSNFDIKKLLGENKKSKKKSHRRKKSSDKKPSLDDKRQGENSEVEKGDSTDVKKPKEPKEPGTPVYQYPLILTRVFTDRIKPVRGSYKRDRRLSRNGFLKRPHYLFRLGFSDDPQAEIKSDVSGQGQINSETKTDGYKLSSGMDLILGTSIDVSWTYNESEASNRANRDESITFPDLSFNFSKFKLLGFTKLFAKSFKLSSKFVRKENRSIDKAGGFFISRTLSNGYSPLIKIDIQWKFATGFSSSFNLTNTVSDRENYFQTGERIGEINTLTKDFVKNFTVKMGYTFRSGKSLWLPLLGKIKMQSNLSLDLDISKRTNRTEQHNPGEEVKITSERTDFSVQPRGTYSFSTNIKGGFTARWQDTTDRRLGKKSHVRELGFWVEIKF